MSGSLFAVGYQCTGTYQLIPFHWTDMLAFPQLTFVGSRFALQGISVVQLIPFHLTDMLAFPQLVTFVGSPVALQGISVVVHMHVMLLLTAAPPWGWTYPPIKPILWGCQASDYIICCHGNGKTPVKRETCPTPCVQYLSTGAVCCHLMCTCHCQLTCVTVVYLSPTVVVITTLSVCCLKFAHFTFLL